MAPPGLAAFERRDQERTTRYSYERDTAKLSAADVKAFRETPGAWDFFRAQPPGYQKLCTHFIVSAKKPETRAKRLEMVVTHAAKGKRVKWM